MGSLEIEAGTINIVSHITTYGGAATGYLTRLICEEIEQMWNEPVAPVEFAGTRFQLRFRITGNYQPDIPELEVISNTDPRRNFFRIEELSQLHISFVDGLGCNTGYFMLANLAPGWTTAAHEYGHTLGLDHPRHLDLRGKGVPGIMYPRGTLVDPQYQYDPSAPAGAKGGTMHPMHRKVTSNDIRALKLEKLLKRGQRVVGGFTNIFHPDHGSSSEAFSAAPIAG